MPQAATAARGAWKVSGQTDPQGFPPQFRWSTRNTSFRCASGEIRSPETSPSMRVRLSGFATTPTRSTHLQSLAEAARRETHDAEGPPCETVKGRRTGSRTPMLAVAIRSTSPRPACPMPPHPVLSSGCRSRSTRPVERSHDSIRRAHRRLRSCPEAASTSPHAGAPRTLGVSSPFGGLSTRVLRSLFDIWGRGRESNPHRGAVRHRERTGTG